MTAKKQPRGLPRSNGDYFRTGGAWHEEGLAMFIEADGAHGILAEIATKFEITNSTVSKIARSKSWERKLAESKKARVDAVVEGHPLSEGGENLGIMSLPEGVDLRSPEMQERLRRIEQAVGSSLLRRGVGALQEQDITSATAALKVIETAMGLLSKAHGADRREASLDVNVQIQALGKLLNPPAEDVKRIEANVVDVEYAAPAEPDWSKIAAKAKARPKPAPRVEVVDETVKVEPEVVADDGLTPEERAAIEDMEAEWGDDE